MFIIIIIIIIDIGYPDRSVRLRTASLTREDCLAVRHFWP